MNMAWRVIHCLLPLCSLLLLLALLLTLLLGLKLM
jgi:hypothetical protein